MKKIWKRVISITLCFVMVFGLIGTSIPAAKAADPEELLVVDGVGGIRWDAPGALIKRTGTVTIYERKYVTQDNNGDGFISQGEYEVTNTILETKEVTIRSTSNRFYDSVAEGWNLVDISSSNITPNLTLTSDGHIQNPSVMRTASSGFTINLYFSHKCQCGDPDCTCPGGCDCRPGCTCYNWIEGGKGCAGSVRTVNINAYQNYRYDSAWTTDSDGEGNYTHEAGYAYEYCLPYDVFIPRVSSDYSCFTDSGHVVRVSWDDPNSDISWATFYDSETILDVTSVPAIALPVDIELTFTPLFKDNSTYVMGWSNANLADDNLTYFDKVRDYPEQHGLGPAGSTTSNGSEALISLDRNLTAIIESYGQIALTLYLDWTKIADHSSEWVTASYQLAGDDTGAKLSGTQYHYVHKNGSTVTNGSTGVSNDSTTPSSDSDGSVLTSKSFTPPSVTLSDNNVFRFDGWYFDSSYTNPYKLTQLRNYTGNNFTLYGKTTRTGYYITSTAQNGTITPNGKQVYSIGSDQTFTYQPNTGYVIDYVVVDGAKLEKQYEEGAEYQSSYTFSNVQQDHTIEAVFALDANGNGIPDYVEGHSLVYDANGGTGAPTDAGKHLSGDEVTLADGSGMTHAAQGETDVVFIGWTAQEDGKIYAKGDTAPATLTKVTFEEADITVYAVWGLDSNKDGIADVTQTWHTITATTGEHGSISPSGAVSVLAGAEQRFTMTPAAGYAVDQITIDGTGYTNDGTTAAPGGTWTSYTFEAVSTDHTISVTFGEDQNGNGIPDANETSYSLVYDANGGTGAPTDATEYLSGDEVTLADGSGMTHAAQGETDVVFIGWTAQEDGKIYAKGDTAPATLTKVTFEEADITVYAVWGLDSNKDGIADVTQTWHTITATTGEHGSISPSGAVSVLAGAEQRFTMTPAAGYAVDQITIDGTGYTNDGTKAAPGGTWTSYTFEAVSTDHTISVTFGEDQNDNGIPDANETSYSLVYDANGGTGAPTDATEYLSGDEVTLADGSGMTHAAQGETDVVFIGWTAQEDGKIYAKGDTAPATLTKVTFEEADITVYAVWGLDSNKDGIADVTQTWHTITATTGEHGSISPSGAVSVLAGAEQRFTMTPAAGYAVDQITIDGTGYTNDGTKAAPGGTWTSYTFEAVSTDHTISVTFGEDQNDNGIPDANETSYSLVYDANGGTGAPTDATEYLSGDEVTLADGSGMTHAAQGETDVVFIGWTAQEDGKIYAKGDTAPATLTKVTFEEADITVYAVWGLDSNKDGIADVTQTWHTITATTGEHGSISPSGAVSVLAGAEQRFTMTPAAGYAVDQITIDGTGYTNDGTKAAPGGTWTSYTFEAVSTDHTISVTFGEDQNGNGIPDANETSYSLVYDANGGTGAPTDATEYLSGDEVTLADGSGMTHAAQGETDVVFIGWTAQEDGKIYAKGDTAPATLTKVTFEEADITVYAAWGLDSNKDGIADVTQTWHTITATTGEHGSISPSGAVSVLAGAEQRFTMTPAAGYAVDQITIDGTGYTNDGTKAAPGGTWTSYAFEAVSADHTISVTFGEDQNDNGIPDANETSYSLVYDANGGTGAPTDAEKYLSGDEVTLADGSGMTHAAQDETDVVFIGWTAQRDDKIYAKGDAAPATLTEVTFEEADITVYAVWGYDTDENGIADVLEHVITITPADITTYMGGEHGYEGAVDVEGDTVVVTGSDSLPEPGFTINGLEDGVDPLSLVLHGAGGRTWTVKLYDGLPANAVRKLYQLEPGTSQEPVRVQFKDDDDHVTISDQFTVGKYVNQTLEMSIYSGGAGDITVQVGTTEYTVKTGTGSLHVRGTTSSVQYAPVLDETSQIAHNTIGVTAPAGTIYQVNGSEVQVEDTSGVALLSDEIINTSGTTDRIDALKERADRELKNASGSLQYEFLYLDLVDSNNGNAWVKASNDVTVYWPLPAGTDRNTKFTLLHFKGLHRDMTSGVIESEIANCEVEVIEVTNDGAHLSFEIGSAGFSPFGLVWQKTSSPSHPSEPTETPQEEELIYTPNWLNTEEHKAYITGYASGEIKPENHITRAEVAMIFYRLLTDEARERFASETNPYSDVKKGDWYHAAVSTLSNMGILNGYNDGTFRPNNTITRAEFAKIAVCFYDYRNIQATNTFVDVEDGAWYENYVAIAAEIGLIEGYSNNTFRPNNSITRAETCTIVNRMLHRAPHEDYLLPTDEMAIWPDNPKNAWYYVQMQEASVSHNYIMQNGYEVWKK